MKGVVRREGKSKGRRVEFKEERKEGLNVKEGDHVKSKGGKERVTCFRNSVHSIFEV